MTAKQLVFTAEARHRLLGGVDALADVVKLTLGPRGRNVLIEASYGSPSVTKDGVTVANAVELDDRFQNMGAQMVREVADKTSAMAGDGTTTATVLAQAIYREGSRLVAAGNDPMNIKRGIDRAVECVVVALAAMATPIKERREIAQVGSISANGDREVGDKLAEAMDRVGHEGIITVEESKGTETTLEIVEGLQFDRGYSSPYFVTDVQSLEAILEDAFVLVSERKVSSMPDLVPLLELVAQQRKPLVIIADDIDGDALATLVVNKLRGSVACVAVKAPSFGDRRKDALRDIAVVAGAQTISEELGLELAQVTLADLGRARRVIVSKDTTTIVDGAGSKENIAARADTLRAELGRATSSSDEDRLRQRIAKLAAGVAVLKIGAQTELEMKEKKARVDDGLRATRAAVQEGIVPGGGVALIRAQAALATLRLEAEQSAGVQIVHRALEEPLRQIAANAGIEGANVVERVRAGTGDFGYDAATDEYGALLERGVIDPVRVVRSALQNAASVAGMMLTTECLIAEQSSK
jgi:chaperonin GroEL